MSVLVAVLVLVIFQLLGDVLVQLSGVPLPGALIGMVLLLLALVLRGRVPAGLQLSAGQLLRHMMLLFIPAVAGIIVHLDRLSREWLPFLLACVVGSALTVAVTAAVFRWTMLRAKAAPKA